MTGWKKSVSTGRHPKPFVWAKSADEILETLAAYCQRIIGSGRWDRKPCDKQSQAW